MLACGQTKRPRSSRFASKHSPSPLHHSTLIMSPRRPRNTNTWPLNGSSARAVCTLAARPLKPERVSVTLAAIQMVRLQVPLGVRPEMRMSVRLDENTQQGAWRCPCELSRHPWIGLFRLLSAQAKEGQQMVANRYRRHATMRFRVLDRVLIRARSWGTARLSPVPAKA